MTIQTIRDLLARKRENRAEKPEDGAHRQRVAAAALMVECARIDGTFSDEERQSISDIVCEHLDLDRETAESLLTVAERRNDEVWHDWLFTSTIRSACDEGERLSLIDRLWDVTYADGMAHPFETHLVERIGSELGLSDESVRDSGRRANQRASSRRVSP